MVYRKKGVDIVTKSLTSHSLVVDLLITFSLLKDDYYKSFTKSSKPYHGSLNVKIICTGLLRLLCQDLLTLLFELISAWMYPEALTLHYNPSVRYYDPRSVPSPDITLTSSEGPRCPSPIERPNFIFV